MTQLDRQLVTIPPQDFTNLASREILLANGPCRSENHKGRVNLNVADDDTMAPGAFTTSRSKENVIATRELLDAGRHRDCSPTRHAACGAPRARPGSPPRPQRPWRDRTHSPRRPHRRPDRPKRRRPQDGNREADDGEPATGLITKGPRPLVACTSGAGL